MRKYHFGCGKKSIKGYTNIDALNIFGNVDIVHDLTEIPYPFAKNNEAEEIVAIEFLEHISFRDTNKVLKEWYRILNYGGKLYIQVPDCGKAMEYYVDKQICECVLNKPQNNEDVNVNPNCPKCKGKGKINPIRWLFSFTGAQKSEFDVHRNVFTKKILEKDLRDAGFNKITIKSDKYGWKIIAEAIK